MKCICRRCRGAIRQKAQDTGAGNRRVIEDGVWGNDAEFSIFLSPAKAVIVKVTG